LLATFYVVKILNGEFCKNWEGGIAAKRTSVSSDFGELSRAVEPRKREQRETSRHQTEVTTKIAEIAKKKYHKFLSLCSLRSFAVIILLELHDSTLLHCNTVEPQAKN